MALHRIISGLKSNCLPIKYFEHIKHISTPYLKFIIIHFKQSHAALVFETFQLNIE